MNDGRYSMAGRQEGMRLSKQGRGRENLQIYGASVSFQRSAVAGWSETNIQMIQVGRGEVSWDGRDALSWWSLEIKFRDHVPS